MTTNGGDESLPIPIAATPASATLPARRLTLFRLLRTLLALNLAVGACVAVNSARAQSIPENFILPGPLWLAVDESFTTFSPCGMTVVIALAGAMVSPLIWPRWWTAVIAVLALGCWLWIGAWVAMVCAC